MGRGWPWVPPSLGARPHLTRTAWPGIQDGPGGSFETDGGFDAIFYTGGGYNVGGSTGGRGVSFAYGDLDGSARLLAERGAESWIYAAPGLTVTLLTGLTSAVEVRRNRPAPSHHMHTPFTHTHPSNTNIFTHQA